MLAMSTTEFSGPNNVYKKPAFHRRNDSGELDVFEAATYFSGATEIYSCRGGIISLKVQMRNSSLSNPQAQVMQKPVVTKEKTKPNNKQPTSPGGKIAHFLVSLFNQTNSKKKKKQNSATPQSMKDHEFDESSWGVPRKRRSSMSHLGSAPIADQKPISDSGFRTPPPYASCTPTKDFRSYSEYQKPIYLQKIRDFSCLDGKVKVLNLSDGNCQTENKELRKCDDHVEDDGAESDSSSDLFELENCDVGYYSSSGLPVYETTHVDRIKRGEHISSRAI